MTVFDWFSVVALALALIALVVSIGAARVSLVRFHQSALARRMIDLESEMTALLGAWEQTQSWAKKVNARLYQAERREVKKPNGKDDSLPDPAKDPQGWRDAVARQYTLNPKIPGGEE